MNEANQLIHLQFHELATDRNPTDYESYQVNTGSASLNCHKTALSLTSIKLPFVDSQNRFIKARAISFHFSS